LAPIKPAAPVTMMVMVVLRCEVNGGNPRRAEVRGTLMRHARRGLDS
jgi:hypothetical protein